MKWFQFPVTLSLFLFLALFQAGQFFDSNSFVLANFLVTQSDYGDPSEEELKWMSLGFESEPMLPSSAQIKFNLQFENNSFLIFSFFRGASPFWRPPPRLDPSHHPFI